MKPVRPVGSRRFPQAESPRWLGGDRLIWVDMVERTLNEGLLAAGDLRITRTTSWPEGIGCAVPVEGSAAILVATGRALVLLGPDGSRHQVAELPPGSDFFNDGTVDPHGRLWVGTQADPRHPTAALYSLDADGVLRRRLDGVTVSNGICFTADGRTMFYIDTLPHRSLDAFDVDDGRLSGRRSVHAFETGNPDGAAIDSDGCVWVAVWDAAEVVRITPVGEVLERIALPASRPTAVALMGDQLVVTTARVGLARPGPLDGAILAVTVDTPGSPAACVRRPAGRLTAPAAGMTSAAR